MSLQSVSFYVCLDDGTIVRTGVVQQDHFLDIDLDPGETLRVGSVNPFTHFDEAGVLKPFTPEQAADKKAAALAGKAWKVKSGQVPPFKKIG